jgi:putative heme-binding domain-containing protein
VTLRVPGGGERIVRRSEIGSIERPAQSMMPDGLEAGLTPQEMADLLEFLVATPAAK